MSDKNGKHPIADTNTFMRISSPYEYAHTGAKLDGLTRSLAHPTWRTSEAVSNQGSVRAVAVWVGLLKWDYYLLWF